MRTVRNHMAWFAGLCLATQLAVLMVVPCVLCADTRDTPGTATVQCACPHAASHPCSLHAAPSPSTTSTCSCRGTTDGATAVLASLIGPTAVLAEPVPGLGPASGACRPQCSERHPLDSCIVPVSPPPRA